MKTELKIEGMHCVNCANRLQKALAAIAGVESAKVELDAKLATLDVDNSQVSLEQLKKVVDDCGFAVVD